MWAYKQLELMANNDLRCIILAIERGEHDRAAWIASMLWRRAIKQLNSDSLL